MQPFWRKWAAGFVAFVFCAAVLSEGALGALRQKESFSYPLCLERYSSSFQGSGQPKLLGTMTQGVGFYVNMLGMSGCKFEMSMQLTYLWNRKEARTNFHPNGKIK